MVFLETMAIWLVLFAYLGLISGYILKKISPEEMVPGKIYYKYFQMAIAIVIGLVSLSLIFTDMTHWTYGLFFVGLLFGFFIKNAYPVFAIFIPFVAAKSGVVIAALIFWFGMLESSLNWKKNLLFENLFYFVLPAIVLIHFGINSYLNEALVISFVSGFILSFAYKILSRY